jgi:hypothetical protein
MRSSCIEFTSQAAHYVCSIMLLRKEMTCGDLTVDWRCWEISKES